MRFRAASCDDLIALNAISRASKQYWGYPDEWIAAWREDLTLTEAQLEQQCVLLAELDGQPVGFCAILENELVFEIMHLWLLPAYIGRGYGKQLLDAALATCTRADKPITVVADPNAAPFYQKQGFQTVDRMESKPKGRYLPVMKKG